MRLKIHAESSGTFLQLKFGNLPVEGEPEKKNPLSLPLIPEPANQPLPQIPGSNPLQNQLATFITNFCLSSPLQVFRILNLAVVRIIGSFLFLCTNRETWAKWPRVFSRHKSRRQVRVQCLTCPDVEENPGDFFTTCLGNPQKVEDLQICPLYIVRKQSATDGTYIWI